MAAEAEPSVAMKLLVDTQTNRVLFAEASKDCVDILFHMISLPIATVVTLLREDDDDDDGMVVGSIHNISQSIQNLHESYILAHHTRDSLLKPNSRACNCSVPVLKLCDVVPPRKKKFYSCDYCSHRNIVADDPKAVCPNCSRKMNTPVIYVPPPPPAAAAGGIEGGFVKAVVTYMVMDDLKVTPMSTISCIALLKKFGVGDVSVLQELNVNLGFKEVVKLFKASLHSNKVLSEVFLPKIEPKVTEPDVGGGDVKVK